MMMARFRKRDSSPEVELRSALHKAGVLFRTYPKLPGSPDLILEGGQLVVFVHGCFWHGCPRHYRAPRTKRKYWSRKLEKNRARDRAVSNQLRRMGFRVAVVWECSVKSKPDAVVKRLLRRRGESNGDHLPSRGRLGTARAERYLQDGA